MKAKLFGILGLLIVLCVLGAIGNPKFLQPNNIENLVSRTSMYGILAIGVAFVIITGGIDLSIGSIVCLSGCLLALFLQVDYQPFDSAEVALVRAKDQKIALSDVNGSFQPGDRVYYDRGRQAKNSIAIVNGISEGSEKIQGKLRTVTRLQLDRPLSSNDYYGRVSKVHELRNVGGDGKRLTIQGEHGYLGSRDQIVLVNAGQSGLKRVKIETARVTGGNTELDLSGTVGSNVRGSESRPAGATDDWVVILEERRQRLPVPAALGLVLLVALGLGLLHGLLVTRLKVQSFVVTLCGLLFYRGISRWLVNDQPVGFGGEYDQTLSQLGSGKLVLWDMPHGADVGIPYPFFILLIVAIVAAIFLNKTIWGRYMLALGRNEEAARYSGINTARMIMIAYVISTCLAAVGGILFALDSNSISPSSFGNFFELYAIAAAVLGGSSLRGGEGTIAGVIIGTAVMRVLNNLIILMKISDTLEFAIIGMVILLGVIADELIRRLAATRRRKAQARLAAS